MAWSSTAASLPPKVIRDFGDVQLPGVDGVHVRSGLALDVAEVAFPLADEHGDDGGAVGTVQRDLGSGGLQTVAGQVLALGGDHVLPLEATEPEEQVVHLAAVGRPF